MRKGRGPGEMRSRRCERGGGSGGGVGGVGGGGRHESVNNL